MNYFMLKARTLNGDWFPFTILDLPTMYTQNEFVNLGLPGSPRLHVHPILRGDFETGLYEGDVLDMGGEKWLICYERGFYAISQSYVIRYLYTLTDYKVIGTYDKFDIGINCSFKEKHIFKYNGNHFRLRDIYGCHEGKLIIRDMFDPVDANHVQQEACFSYKGRRVFLGDSVDCGIVECRGGRLTATKGSEIIDLTTGGVLSGYIPGSNGRS